MDSLIEKMYEEIYQNKDKYFNSKECVASDQQTAKLLKEFKEYVPLAQLDLFDELWRSVLDGDRVYGYAQFKVGFKLGIKLACECLKG